MAGIDHTIIYFKNGRLVRDESFFDTNDKFVCLPKWIYGLEINGKKVKWSRDAELLSILDVKKEIENNQFVKYPFWDGYSYEKRFLSNIKPRKFAEWLEKSFPKRVMTEYVKHIKTDEFEIFSYISSECNILYMFVGNDSYVLVGGYGHMSNPYTHFFNRGYGETFENRMSKECYRWACETFEEVIKAFNKKWYLTYAEEDVVKEYYKKLQYKDYFDMDDNEREAYNLFNENDEIA